MKDCIKHTVTSSEMVKQCYRDTIEMLKEHGWCTVEIKAGVRTMSQNALYWVWIREITTHLNMILPDEAKMDEHGVIHDLTEMYMHTRLKKRFLGDEPIPTIGKLYIQPQIRSTAQLTKHEMMHYMTQIEVYAVDIGCELTIPADSQYFKLKQAHETGE